MWFGRRGRAGILGLAAWCAGWLTAAADDWPKWRGPTGDGVWHETDLVERFSEPQIKILWKAPIANGYSGPTVADGRVYVTDRVAEPLQVERVHCFDWKTGESLWTHTYDCVYRNISYDDGPRASVTIDEGHAYSLGTMGHLFCFDAATGDVLWRKDTDADYKIRMQEWGIAASPVIEDGLLIVQVGGEKGACLVAFNKKTGEEKWRALADRPSYSTPIVIEQGGRRVLACWTGDNVVGLDPATGEVYWSELFKPSQMVLSIVSPVVEQNRLFVSGFYDGSLMLRLDTARPAAEKLWRRAGANENNTDSLHSLISTPYLEGDYVYGVDSNGELRCLDAETGDRRWESLEPMRAPPKVRWFNIHMVRNGDKMWMFNERGELVIAALSPAGYHEISRAKLIKPTSGQSQSQRRPVCWSHPAYAYRHVFARNDVELVAADLSAPEE